MKTASFVLLLLLAISLHCRADIGQVKIGVNGLTCSQCTRSVEMSLRKLDFVQDVTMDLAHTEGVIRFRTGAHVDLSKIALAVHDAGFSLRSMHATMDIGPDPLPGNCLNMGSDLFVFLNHPPPPEQSSFQVQLIGEKFLLKKDLKRWKPLMKHDCGNVAGKTYYVTL